MRIGRAEREPAMKRALLAVLILFWGSIAPAQEVLTKSHGIRSDPPAGPKYMAMLQREGILNFCGTLYYLNARDRPIALRTFRVTGADLPQVYIFEVRYIVKDGKNIVLDLLKIDRRDRTGLKTLYQKPPSDPIDRFLALPKEKQIEFIHKWEKEKGVQNTEKLAKIILAVNTVDVLPIARSALANSLTLMTDKTLRDYLGDEDKEIREATGVALALKALARERELIAKEK
jgi:hypothetical protein